MKKFLILLTLCTTIVLSSSFTSCSNSSGGDSGNSSGNNNSPDTAITNDIYTSDIDTPLTLEAINSICTITIENPWSTLKYQINNGPVTNVTNTRVSLSINAHQKVSFFAERSENRIEMERSRSIPINMTIKCNQDCYIYGNIMSLLDPDEYNTDTITLSPKAFEKLFNENIHIKNHDTKELVLPAQTLAMACYSYMFSGCTGLTKAPSLPAQALEPSCYQNMFSGCTGLTQAPVLSANTLKQACYAGMFSGCTSLTQAPFLPAETLVPNCYQNMFNGCTNLKSITCLAKETDSSNTDISNCTRNWVKKVSSSGTFKRNLKMQKWQNSKDLGLPSEWNVIFYNPAK